MTEKSHASHALLTVDQHVSILNFPFSGNLCTLPFGVLKFLENKKQKQGGKKEIICQPSV
jgi:hypothetical protein